VGTWGTGSFDDDTAVDWCDALDALPTAERASFVRATLRVVLDTTDYLDAAPAVRAVAAAAVVASQGPGGSHLIRTAGAPAWLAGGGVLDTAGLVDVARRALDRVISDSSQWRDVWASSPNGAEAFAQLHAVRALLVPVRPNRDKDFDLTLW
jgi:hypothetical protein